MSVRPNYVDVRLAHLHNKFGTPNSVEVPDTGVVINEDFVEIENVLRIPEQILHFHVYWVIKDVSGTICVPGQWNYAYIDGRFFHLTKGDSMGFIKGSDEEGFYYNVTYDDWQNDWMKNRIYLKGTLDLTGDGELVKKNLHQIAPLIENVNNRRFLNGVRIQLEERPENAKLLLPERLTEHLQAKTQFTVWERKNFNTYLREWWDEIQKNPEKQEPVEERLVIPLLYRMTKSGNWKHTILKAIKYHADMGFVVHDVTRGAEGNENAQAAKFRNLLQNLLHTDNLYAVASRSNRVYVHARAVNPAVYVDEVDLSGCTDITLLDTMTLAKRYTLDNPAPKFNLNRFVDWVCRRQEWNSNLKDQLKNIFQEEFINAFGKILASGGTEDNKVFRDVTMEKIERDVVYTDRRTGIATLNPEWLSWADTRLRGEHQHKNFIWDHIDRIRFPHDYYGFNEKFKDLTNEQKNELKANYRKGMEDPKYGFVNKYGLELQETSYGLINSNFIYLPDKYKMVSTDDRADILDFSYNYNDKTCEGLAVTPDYDRKTHVISILNNTILTDDSYEKTFTYNQKNSRHRNRKDEKGKPVPIYPIVFREITKVEESDVVIDGQKPSTEFLRVYKTLGKNNSHPKDGYGNWDINYRSNPTPLRDAGAEILSRGYAFMALQNEVNSSTSEYLISNENGNTIDYNHNKYETLGISRAQRPECVYTNDKREWRRFHTEMTFPVKTDGFSIINKLREFDDIPDNFLRWEVVNTNIRKGKIKVYTRSYVGAGNDTTKTRDNSKPGAYRLTKEEEAKIPPNTVVSIYICLRQSGSPEGDAAFDKKASDEYRTKYGREGSTRMNELLYGLCRYYFLTKWEGLGETGAIPDGIKVYGAPNYPPNGDGRSQIGLSWMKPHQGKGYVAGTRFFAPAIHNAQPLRVMDNSGKLFPMIHNGNPSNDFIAAYIQKNYDNSANYPPTYAYRKHSSAVDMNTLLAFYYGNLVSRGRASGNKNGKTKEQAIADTGNTNNNPKDLPKYIYKVLPEEDKIKPDNLFSIIVNYYPFSLSTGYKGLPYEAALYEGQQYLMGWDTILLENYIRNAKTYKSRRLDNPKEIPNEFYDPYNIKKFTILEDEIPPFMVHFIDPEDKLSNLHNGLKNPIVKNDGERFQLFRDKIKELFRATTEMLETGGVFMKFEGTNGYANMQLNTKDMVWDFELFCDEPTMFKTRGQDKWNFVNHKEEDVDVLINTRNELSIYGNKFVLKSRQHTTEDELDIGLYVKPLLDQKQTLAAQWYGVSMRYNEQDVIEEIVETPKEITAYAGYNYLDKERLVRELGMQNAEYMYKKQMIEYQKSENKINDTYEKDMNHYAWKYSVIDGSLQLVLGLVDMGIGAFEVATSIGGMRFPKQGEAMDGVQKGNVYRLENTVRNYSPWEQFSYAFQKPGLGHEDFYKGVGRPPNRRYQTYHTGTPEYMNNRRMSYYAMRGASTFTKGMATVMQGGMNIGKAYDEGYAKDVRRKDMFNLTNQKLLAEGNYLNVRHEHDRNMILREIWEQSANVSFPQLNSALVYKEHNKQRNLNDIHMVQYYPSGKLAEYLKKYYREFGYQIMVRNFECTGIDSIKNHLRYQFVYENIYNDITIKSLIQTRAMQGIKVIPGVQ